MLALLLIMTYKFRDDHGALVAACLGVLEVALYISLYQMAAA